MNYTQPHGVQMFVRAYFRNDAGVADSGRIEGSKTSFPATRCCVAF
jgi:hypothetical protein